MPKIGVLAIQGDFLEHQRSLRHLGFNSPEIRLPHQLDEIDGLIIPGGESTTIIQLIDIFNFRKPLVDKVKSGLPVWGSCAGMIVLANQLADKRPEPLHLMDIEVSRNAFGRQIDSFEEDLDINDIDGPSFRAVFIRAPLVTRIGKDVKIMATLKDGKIVAVRQGNMLATAFHPELTNDHRMHDLFVKMVVSP